MLLNGGWSELDQQGVWCCSDRASDVVKPSVILLVEAGLLVRLRRPAAFPSGPRGPAFSLDSATCAHRSVCAPGVLLSGRYSVTQGQG